MTFQFPDKENNSPKRTKWQLPILQKLKKEKQRKKQNKNPQNSKALAPKIIKQLATEKFKEGRHMSLAHHSPRKDPLTKQNMNNFLKEINQN